ncbi:MAG: hypothetical protein JWO40_814 [Candidatus Doudnabacteria bacterium]|nr:hypothetical protein [Candidatus Doudnabacteria bacterium]
MIEQYLDKAIQQVRNGEEISAVVSNYPAEVRSELTAMLQIIALVSSLPRKEVPAANHRRLYLKHTTQTSRVGTFFRTFKMVPTALATLVLIVIATASGAHASLPGDKLFVIKKTYESLQVKLATNPEKRADLQLQIASQRFEDAQKVLAKDNNDEDKKVAIAELNQQTAVALSDIKDTAVSISKQNPGLVQQAENLTKSQTNLMAKVDPKLADSVVLKTTQQSTAAIQNIKKIIAAANEESGAAIAPNPKISTTGTISQIKDNTVSIAKNLFITDDKTSVTDETGATIKVSDLKVNDSVTVEAAIDHDKNMAQTITVITRAKVEKTDKPATKESKTETKATEPKNTNNDNSTEVILPDPNKDTFGGFIPEPPAIFPGTVNQ